MSKILQTIYQSLQTSLVEYRVIWPQLVIFQCIARVLQYIGLAIISQIGITNILKDTIIDTNLTNFELLNALDIKKVIIFGFLIGSVTVISFIFEFLGLIYITRSFHRGEPIYLRKTLLKTLAIIPRFLRVISLQIAILFGILLFSGLICLTVFTLIPQTLGIFMIGVVLLLTLLSIWSTFIKFTYAPYRVFNKSKTFFGLFDYKLNKPDFIELNIFSITLVIATALALVIGSLFVNSLITLATLFTDSITILSGISGFVITFSIVITTFLSVVYNSVFTIYNSRKYHEIFSKIVLHKPGTHDYNYESKFANLWYKQNKLIILSIVVVLITGITVQSISVKKSLTKYLNNDFLTMAHRGGNKAPENTLEAINKSIEDQVDMVEVDLQLTRDNQIVVYHDENLKKVSSNKIVHYSNFSELQPLTYPTGEKIPTFEELLNQTNNKIALNLELKIYDDRESEFIKEFLIQLTRIKSDKKLIITSLDYNLVNAIEEYDLNIETGFIITASVENLQAYNTDYFMVNDLFYRSREQMFKSTTKPIVLWSFDSSFDGSFAFEKGLAGAITDQGDVLQDIENTFATLSFNQKINQIILWTID